MASQSLLTQQGLRIAVQGCGHGVLHDIYASVAKACELKGWPDVDLLIIGGDFQAVRNASDLKAISMPSKYYAMHDFHEYYSGKRVAPYLTVFIGGNHEASNYLWELYHGGWTAPNIYYMGAANVLRLGPLRIAGLSGIWKGYDYKKPHFERLPYSGDDVRSIYHVRELDVRKLLQIRTQVDIGLSHDWPRGMEWKGNFKRLFHIKPDFEQEAKDGTLGSVAATKVLKRLRPHYWFSAHMHVKFSAVWEHENRTAAWQSEPETNFSSAVAANRDDVLSDVAGNTLPGISKNDDEIELDLEDEVMEPAELGPKSVDGAQLDSDPGVSKVPQEIRDLLPASFARPTHKFRPMLPFPQDITNLSTKFLALDKCLPKRSFLQLLEVHPHSAGEIHRPLKLEYDQEWLAIARVFANDLQIGDANALVPDDKGEAFYGPLIEEQTQWVEEHIVKAGKMIIPEDFVPIAPVHSPEQGIHTSEHPQEYSNPHTQAFCDLLQIHNAFHASEEERAQLMERGPRRKEPGHDEDRAGGSGNRARGGGPWRGRGRGGRGGRGRGR